MEASCRTAAAMLRGLQDLEDMLFQIQRTVALDLQTDLTKMLATYVVLPRTSSTNMGRESPVVLPRL